MILCALQFGTDVFLSSIVVSFAGFLAHVEGVPLDDILFGGGFLSTFWRNKLNSGYSNATSNWRQLVVSFVFPLRISVISPGMDLLFTRLPKALSLLIGSFYWTVLYFLMLTLLSLSYQVHPTPFPKPQVLISWSCIELSCRLAASAIFGLWDDQNSCRGAHESLPLQFRGMSDDEANLSLLPSSLCLWSVWPRISTTWCRTTCGSWLLESYWSWSSAVFLFFWGCCSSQG